MGRIYIQATRRDELYRKTIRALAMIANGVTAQRAAIALGISRQTLYRGFKLVESRDGPGSAHGRRTHLKPDADLDLDPLLDGWYESVNPVTDLDTDPEIDDLLA